MVVEYSAIKESLKKLGLSELEARSYIELLKLEEADALTIAEKAKVPKGKIYGILDILERKGLISYEVIGKRSKTFFPKDIKTGIMNLKNDLIKPLEEAVNFSQQALEDIKGISRNEAIPEREVIVLNHQSTIIQTSIGLINSAQVEIFSTFRPDFLVAIAPALAKAKQQGIIIKCLFREDEKTILNQSIILDDITTEIASIDFDNLLQALESIPIAIAKLVSPDITSFEKTFKKSTLYESLTLLATKMQNFSKLTKNRPNILFIDPKSEQPILLVALRSNSQISDFGIYLTNKIFLNFLKEIIDLLWSILV